MNVPLLIADSSTLLNFLVVGQIELILGMGYAVHVVDAVIYEVLSEKDLLEQLVREGRIIRVTLEGDQITQRVAALSACGLGAGEALSLAAAIELKAAMAIDDRRAVKRAAAIAGQLTVVDSVELVVTALRDGRIDLNQADAIKKAWEHQHRFKLKFASFGERVKGDGS